MDTLKCYFLMLLGTFRRGNVTAPWTIFLGHPFKARHRLSSMLAMIFHVSGFQTVSKLHEPGHQQVGHKQFPFNFTPVLGLMDGEYLEHILAGHNMLRNVKKTQGPSSRHNVLDDHFNFWNWSKYLGMGASFIPVFLTSFIHRYVLSPMLMQ